MGRIGVCVAPYPGGRITEKGLAGWKLINR
jgi:hypothetical protein